MKQITGIGYPVADKQERARNRTLQERFFSIFLFRSTVTLSLTHRQALNFIDRLSQIGAPTGDSIRSRTIDISQSCRFSLPINCLPTGAHFGGYDCQNLRNTKFCETGGARFLPWTVLNSHFMKAG